MRLVAIFSALALTATAYPLQKRQAPVANEVLNKITAQLQDMDKAIQAFSWSGSGDDAVAASKILDFATDVLKTMKDGVKQIQAAPQLGLGETIGILGPLGSLTQATNQVTVGLKGKKKDFEGASLSAVVADQLVVFNQEAKVMVDATLDKLPLPTALTGMFAQPILTSLADALTAFGGPGGSSATPSSSSSSSLPAAGGLGGFSLGSLGSLFGGSGAAGGLGGLGGLGSLGSLGSLFGGSGATGSSGGLGGLGSLGSLPGLGSLGSLFGTPAR